MLLGKKCALLAPHFHNSPNWIFICSPVDICSSEEKVFCNYCLISIIIMIMIIMIKGKCTVKCQFTVPVFLYDHCSRLWLYLVPTHTCKPSVLWYLSPVKPKWVSRDSKKQRLPFLNSNSVPQCASLHLRMMLQYTVLQENSGFNWRSATDNVPQCDQLLGQDSNLSHMSNL